MNNSKSIYEKIKLYRINLIRNKKVKLEKNVKSNLQMKSVSGIKKQSKLKIFFKFILGFFESILEYVVTKSNENKFNENKFNENKFNENKFNENKNNSNIKDKIDNLNIYVDVNLKKADNKNTINRYVENKKDIIINNNASEIYANKKENLILIEEKIIYANTKEELKDSKTKIIEMKESLIIEKEKNFSILNKISEDKNENKNISKKDDYCINKKINIENEETKQEIKLENSDVSDEKVIEVLNHQYEQKILKENSEIDNLIKRCDEDLVLVSEKQEFLNLTENFEKNINNNSANTKINKKDLKKIKESVLSIVEKQKYNLDQLNNYMDKSFEEKIFILKVGNFFKNTAKLAFSFVPFFSFPNKVFGLATSALFFNKSIKSYRIKPNDNNINQSIRFMLNNNESCLRLGISNCNDSLNEIENIKYYLKNLSSEAKDSIEYRKYLLSVESTERLIKKQIEIMKNLSKKYNDIKIKVKKREN